MPSFRGTAGILALLVGSSANGDPRFVSKPKEYALTIIVAGTKAEIMEDGLFVGHSGNAFDSAPGVHALLISSQGFIPRVIYVRVLENAKATTQRVNLLPAPERGTTVELDFPQARAFKAQLKLSDLPSLCVTFNRSGVKLPGACTRSSVIDDLTYFGSDSLIPGSTPSLAWLASDSGYWQAESQYAEAPSSAFAAQSLATSAVLRGDCGRVMEIALETGAARLEIPGLLVARGFCLELSGQPAKAAPLYRTYIAKSGKSGAPYLLPERGNGSLPKLAPDIFYHLARVLSVNDLANAIQTEVACTETLPHDYRCAEALAHLRATAKDLPGAQMALANYWQRGAQLAKTTLLGPPSTWDERKILAAFALRPQIFELAAAASLTGSPPPRANEAMETAVVTDLSLIRRLLPELEAKGKTKGLAAAYRALVRVKPKDATTWIKLAGVLKASDKCGEAIDAVDSALPLVTGTEREVIVLLTKTACLVRLERYSEAKAILLPLLDAYPGSWKVQYNLAVVHDRLGNDSEAAKVYAQVLDSLDAPDNIKREIDGKIKYYREKRLKTTH